MVTSSIFLRLRAAVPFVLATIVASFPAGAIASSVAPPSSRERSEALLVEGDAALERGDLDVAISEYQAAYYDLSAADRASYLGSIPIRKAMVVFEQSIARESDPVRRRKLLQGQRLLLDQFLLDVQAREGAADEIGEDVVAELETIGRAIDEALVAEERGPEVAPGPPSVIVEEQRPASPGSEEHQHEARQAGTGEDRPRGRGKAAGVILGVGVVSVVGGTAMLVDGAWNLVHVRRRSDERLAAIDASDGGTPEMRDALRGEITAWQEKWRGIGTGLAVGGAVLTAAGIGLATWGVVRMRRGDGRGGRVSVVRPVIWGGGVGLVVGGRY